MDLYANPPFITENEGIGTVIPEQIQRADLFAYIETELKAVEAELVAPKANEYGRADQAASRCRGPRAGDRPPRARDTSAAP